jgi:hypothetical protein
VVQSAAGQDDARKSKCQNATDDVHALSSMMPGISTCILSAQNYLRSSRTGQSKQATLRSALQSTHKC